MTTRQLSVRPLLTWLLVSAGLLALFDVLRADLSRLPDLGSLTWTPAFVTTCAGLLAACAGWFWLTLTVALISTACGRRTRWIGAPPWLRRAIVALCGAVALGLPAAAHATPVAGAPPGTPDTPSLEGMSVPTLPETDTSPAPPTPETAPPTNEPIPRPRHHDSGGTRPPQHRPPQHRSPKQRPPETKADVPDSSPATTAPETPEAPAPRTTTHQERPERTERTERQERPRRVVVRPGDSLWNIAGRHRPADATSAEIDRAWRELWEDNHAVIGDDPHLIRPGQQLQIDVEES